MSKRRTNPQARTIEAAIGYAAGKRGSGVAYARVTGPGIRHLLRVPFNVGRTLCEREAGYSAVTAVARTLRARGFASIRFTLHDRSLVDDVANHRSVPEAMVLPYVRLRCALNQLDDFTLEHAGESDLAQRARAEVALNVAA